MAKVIQYHSSVVAADAIGTSIRMLHEALGRAGVDSYVACGDGALAYSMRGAIPAGGLLNASLGFSLSPDDVLLIHYSFYDEQAEQLARLPIKKVMVFHNVTPGEMFREVGQDDLANLCDAARNQFGRMGYLFDASIGVSDFNAAELRSASYPAVATIPVLIDVDAFQSSDENLDLLHQLKKDARINVLFVGRFVPNKRIERVISAIAHFKTIFSTPIRLHLVGKVWNEPYYASLVGYAAELCVAQSIRFHIEIDQRTLRTLYAAADAFVCMSDHEGFMVPIVEAFAAGCPVIALRRTAVGETMGESGLVIDHPDPEFVAGLIHCLVSDSELRNRVVASQGRRLHAFRPRRAVKRWIDTLSGLSPPIAATLEAKAS